MKKLLLAFTDWIMSILERGYREEKPFLSDSDREQWSEEKREYYAKTSDMREDK